MANKMTDDTKLKNEWYTRPDFKPKAAMVNDSSMNYDATAMAQLKQQAYASEQSKEYKKGSWYRIFRPLNADYNIQDNHYAGRDDLNNVRDSKFPLLTNDFADHEN